MQFTSTDILKKIFITELVFHPPIKSKILIYDNASILNGTADVLFKRVKKVFITTDLKK